MKKRNFADNFFGLFDKYPRENFVLGFFGVCACIILYTVLSYTVINKSFYRDLADRQQLGEVVIPVSRGSIYSSTNSGTVLGTSVHLYDVAIDPQMLGDKTKLAIFLRDIVYKQTCYLKSYEDCYDALLKYLRVLEIPDFQNEEVFVKDIILKEIQQKLSRSKVTNDIVATEVDRERVALIESLKLTGIYIDGNKIIANPEEINDPLYTAAQLSSILLTPQKQLQKSLEKRDLKYIPIINKINISLSDEIKMFITEEKDAIKKGLITEESSLSNFLIMNANPSRFYPEGDIAAQIVGFVDNDGKGHYGLEGYFNDELKGQKGTMISRKDTLGRTIDPISLEKDDVLSQGVNIYTTIDRNVQRKVEQILEKGVKEYRAVKGTVVVMDPFSGEIISMANYPTYNPNHSGDVYELERVTYDKYPNPAIDLLGYPVFVEDTQRGEEMLYDGKKLLLRTAEREELGDLALIKYKYKNDFGAGVFQNDAVSSLYEPGSIMKSITVAIGVDTGEIRPYDMYNDTGYIEIDNFRIKNVALACLGYKSFQNALNFSCNVGMIRIAQKIGKALFYQYLQDFGFGKVTGITLQGEATGTLAAFERWSNAQLFTTSFGLGISVTPLQMATAYSVIANGGYYVKPKMIKSVVFPNGKEIQYKTEYSHRVIKDSTSKTVINMLVDSIENGVAKNGKVPGYTLAGKTGSAEIAYKGKYESGSASTHASFAGFGPAQEPKFVIIVKLERPKKSIYGDSTSAHIFREIAAYLIDYYGIPKQDTTKK